MKFYFFLQYKRLYRWLDELGLYPKTILVIALALFFLTGLLIISKLPFPGYWILFIQLSLSLILSKRERAMMLQNIFEIKLFKKIRLIENLLVAIPFAIVLLFIPHGLLYFLLSVTLASIQSLYVQSSKFDIKIPTPFSKKPFEFIIGFRRNWFYFLILFGISIISFTVDNYRLGLFCMVDVILLCLVFYTKHEPGFYLWIFDRSPVGFLKEKIVTAIIQAFTLAFPLILTLLILYPESWYITLLALLVSAFYLMIIVLFKYATYPVTAHLPYILSLVFCFAVPPFMLIGIPFFYNKAITKIRMHVNT